MPTNAIAPQTAAANSADITVAAGVPVTLGVMTAVGGTAPFTEDEYMPVRRKNASGTYDDTGLTLSPKSLQVSLSSPGVYRVEKPVTRAALGVNQD